MNKLQWLEELYRLVPELCSRCEKRKDGSCRYSDVTYDEMCIDLIKRKNRGNFSGREPKHIFNCFYRK